MFGTRKRWNDLSRKKGQGRNGRDSVWGSPSSPVMPPELVKVLLGLIARGHAGKTSLLRAIRRSGADELPSGLQIGPGNPLLEAEDAQQTISMEESLHERGLTATLQRMSRQLWLFEGDKERACLTLSDEIGQVISGATPHAPKEVLDQYDELMAHLAGCSVLWALIPCPPPEPTHRDLSRFHDDLRVHGAYLREALKAWKKPGAVALVMPKLDTLFPSAEEARSQLSNERLVEVMRPMVSLVRSTDEVGHAAIFPVSSFGFGTAMLKPDQVETDQASAANTRGNAAGMEEGDLEWILKPGAWPQPYNLATLMVWTMLHGMAYQDATVDPDQERELRGVMHKLASDLQQIDGWHVPVKGAPLA